MSAAWVLTKRGLSSRARTRMRRMRHPGHRFEETFTFRLVQV